MASIQMISTQIVVVVLLAPATMIVVGVAAPQLAEAQTQTSENNAAIDDDSLSDLDIDQILEKFNIGGLDLGALLG